MRPANSVGGMPVYCQTMLTTGMLMFGKMSVGVRRITSGLTINNNSPATMNV